MHRTPNSGFFLSGASVAPVIRALYFQESLVRKFPKWLFLALFTISSLLVVISSSDPIVPFLENTFAQSLLVNSVTKNSILFNLSMGMVVSSIFYVIVVYLPEKQKLRDIQPQVEQYISGILTRSWSLVSETIKHSGKEYEVSLITEEQFLDACKSVNPQNIMKHFHNNGVSVFQQHYGYACANKWDFILKNINDVMYFLPYVDTGLVKILNEIRNSALGITVGSLREIDKLNTTDMSAWSSSIYKVHTLSMELENYYRKHINKKYKHPFKKI
jgi:hypothetical protein